MTLVGLGRREEARAVAAELLSAAAATAPGEPSDPRLIAGEYVLAQVEASEGRFGAALTRARRVLFAEPTFGRLVTADMYLMTLLVDLAVILGRAPDVAEELVRTFVDPEPPRLVPGRFVPSRIASACAFAPKPAARRCFQRLRALMAAGFFRESLPQNTEAFIHGADAYARGDFAAAAAAWRPIAPRPGTQGQNLFPDAFDRAGDHDLADRIDGRSTSMEGPFNGVGLSHLRSARRALARGDRARGESLGRRVIDAWSIADVPVPAVAELRALLGGRPSPAEKGADPDPDPRPEERDAGAPSRRRFDW
jgi:hypothetical protein